MKWENSVPCQLSGFRTHSIEELRKGCWLEMKVGNVGNTSTKEWRETIERRESYDTPKMAQSNGKQRCKTDSGYVKFVKKELDFIQCSSTRSGMVHPRSSGPIGWCDDHLVDPLRVIQCVESIFGVKTYKF